MADELTYKKNSIFSIPLRLLLGINIIIAFPVLCVMCRYAEALKNMKEAGASASDAMKANFSLWTQFYHISQIAICVIAVVSMLLLFCWLRRASANLWIWKIKGLSQKPKWAFLNFIIPFYNLYKPFSFMKELWNATSGNTEDSNWKSNAAPWFLTLLWSFILFAIILISVIPAIRYFKAELISDNFLQTTAEIITCIIILNSILLLSFITGIENRQADFFEQLQSKKSAEEQK